MNGRGIALDIDETLADTNVHWARQLAATFGNPTELSPEELAAKHGYMEQVPHWQTEEAYQWMDHARHSSEFQETIPLIENAHAVVQRVQKIVPVVAYLTARPERTRQGTENWLAKHDFPNAPVIMRPNHLGHEHINEWKAKTLTSSYPSIVGIVDDDARIIEHLPQGYPGVVFLYDAETFDAPEGLAVIPVKTWDDVLAKVEEFFRP
jgi:5'(3')-deoxyribonucleotidase